MAVDGYFAVVFFVSACHKFVTLFGLFNGIGRRITAFGGTCVYADEGERYNGKK